MSTYKLRYWNIPGRGESIRIMLTLGSLDFENDFTPLPFTIKNPENTSPPPFDDGSWAKQKPQTPWGTLPTLTLPDGTIVGQQRAIIRYLGKIIQYEGRPLYPEDPIKALTTDGLMDMLEDIWPILIGLNGTESLDTAPLLTTMLGKPHLIDFLEKKMEPKKGELALMFDHIEKAYSTGPYLLKDQPSCADILLFAAIAWWGAAMFPSMEMILESRPNIKRAIETVGSWKKIKDYYSALKSTRKSLPTVGVTKYQDFYKNFHSLSMN